MADDTQTTTTQTSDGKDSFSLDWKSTLIAAAVTLGVALLVLAIIMLVKNIRKNKEEGKEKVKEGELDKKKEEKKTDKTKEKVADKSVKTSTIKTTTSQSIGDNQSTTTSITANTTASINDLPETKMIKLRVNGVEKEYLGKLNKETGKYQVSIPRTKKSIQDNIVKVSNSNNQIITATQQKKEQSNNELEAIKGQLKTIQGELDKKRKEQENISQFSKVLGSMSTSLLGNVLGGNIVEFGELLDANVVNNATAVTKETINKAMKEDLSAAPKPNEDVTTKYIEPKVIKQEVKNSLETTNKAKEAEKSNGVG